MTAKQKVRAAIGYAGISAAELARRLDWSPQLLNKRLETGKFSIDEWEQIAHALGASAKITITFPDGAEI